MAQQLHISEKRLAGKPEHHHFYQGEVYWLASETAIPHPHVVICENAPTHTCNSRVVVCALTSNLKKISIPGNIMLDDGEANLPRQSVIQVSKLSTLPKTELGAYIGSLSEARVQQIRASLRFLQVSYFQDK